MTSVVRPPVLQWPDSRLRLGAEPITPCDVEGKEFEDKMLELRNTLLRFGHGAWALTGPQIGWHKRAVVMIHPNSLAQISAREDRAIGSWTLDVVGLVNPEIVARRGGKGIRPESCLSFYGAGAELLEAYEDVDVHCPDTGVLNVMPLHVGKLRYVALAARVVSAAVDLLDGYLITDRMGDVQRRLFLTRLRKARTKRRRAA
jgi:peptide deformylase